MPGLAVSDGTALGCALRVVTTEPGGLEAARGAVDAVLAEIDLACSRFRFDSEISAVNAAAGTDVTLSPLLNQALEVALRAAAMTGGAVDPTIGTALRLMGYDRDFVRLPADGAPVAMVARPVPGWRLVAHDAAARRLRVPAGVEIDLGATAKALAADLAAEAAVEAAGGGVLVNLGGDISVAGDAPEGGWVVQLSEASTAPITPGEETVAIVAGGLATSSITVRRWRRGGVEVHHLIDPGTGLPAGGPWRSVTVHAPSCVDANTASTAAIVRGPVALGWLESRRLPARLVRVDGSVERIGGWPA